jgi:two-component system, OmpR family, sensor histidine kinase KdpD
VARGRLRVYLGAAPGVGKTYRMLDEGWRRHERGTDVVVALVETHGRALTSAQLRELEVIPRVTREYRGTTFGEMDLDAVLARHPAVALVDELAHTNVPGGAHEKRWQDVEAMLEAGIDVISTVNIQHLESVNDVVAKITGITQQETIPDAVVRRAEQIELVDVTPEALRRRMAHGNIYAADKIDASLANYFRVGNLSALRELALLWLADRVEDSLRRYLEDHDIEESWETRERLIVGITGTSADEALLRRAARMASRTGFEILAVHVVPSDDGREIADTSVARALVEEFEGQFQEVVDDDVATALVAIARAERGTQIVLGSSRPRAPWRPASGIVESVLRLARDLDVHIIAVGAEPPRRRVRRRRRRHVSWQRQALASVVAALALAIATASLAPARANLSTSTVFLVYLVVVLGLSTWAGAVVGAGTALVAFGLENYYFVRPYHTFSVDRPDDVVALVAFLVFAVGASVMMSRFSLRSAEASRARAEAEVLVTAAAGVATSEAATTTLLESLRILFDASRVEILNRLESDWFVELSSGDEVDSGGREVRFAIDDDHALVIRGATLDSQDERLVSALTSRIAVALRSESLEVDALKLREIAESESLRLGLFRTVASELRPPLEEVAEQVSALCEVADTDTQPALSDVATQVHHLRRLVTNMLDAGRLEAGDVDVHLENVDVSDLVGHALEGVDIRGREVRVEIAPDAASVSTDPEGARRIIENVLSNACRFSPLDQPVLVKGGAVGELFELLVIDRGPGISPTQRDVILAPFHRLSGEQLTAGLNLTVAAGLSELLGATLLLDDTPGGGLTVTIEFPLGANEH